MLAPFLSRDAKTNGRFHTRLKSHGLRHVPQVVLIFDVLFLFCLKAIALHRINRRRCHYHPFDRTGIRVSIASARAAMRGCGGIARSIVSRFHSDRRRVNRSRDRTRSDCRGARSKLQTRREI